MNVEESGMSWQQEVDGIAFPSAKYPRQESNLIPDLRRVVCDPPHPKDKQEPMAGFAPA